MSDDNKRIHGRALDAKLNALVLVSLIFIGFIFSCLIICIGLGFYTKNPAFILLIGLCAFVIKSLFDYIKKITALKRIVENSLYSQSDKQYVWAIEETRDKLMARVIQEGICPWRETNKCVDLQNCKCEQQTRALKELGLDPTLKKIITLNDKDTGT